MADDAEPVVGDATKADEVAVEAVSEAGKTTEGEKPKEGTPDKALQKMQQELGNVTRQLQALQEKKDDGQQLTEAEKAKLAKAEQRLTKIRQFVSRPERNDVPSEADDIAEEVLDIRDKVREQEVLKGQLAETQKRLQLLENERNWQVAKEKYAGLDVSAIWDKARADALETLGEDSTDLQVNRLASRWFEERCEGAKKRLTGDGKTNNKTSPQSTYKVGSAQTTAPQLSEADELLALARQLVLEE